MNTDNPESEKPEDVAEESPAEGTAEFGEIPKDALTMAMLAHILGGLFCVVGSLIIWIIKKDEHPFIDDQGKEATNFQLMILIGHFVCWILAVVSCGFLFFMPFIPMLVGIIMGIIAGMAANSGQAYRYPFNIRFIK